MICFWLVLRCFLLCLVHVSAVCFKLPWNILCQPPCSWSSAEKKMYSKYCSRKSEKKTLICVRFRISGVHCDEQEATLVFFFWCHQSDVILPLQQMGALWERELSTHGGIWLLFLYNLRNAVVSSWVHTILGLLSSAFMLFVSVQNSRRRKKGWCLSLVISKRYNLLSCSVSYLTFIHMATFPTFLSHIKILSSCQTFHQVVFMYKLKNVRVISLVWIPARGPRQTWFTFTKWKRN